MATTPSLVDVRTLAELEKAHAAYLKALEAAEPAVDRLQAAKYPGVGAFSDAWMSASDGLRIMAESLEDVRLAEGDQAAWDYHFYVKRLGMNIREAAIELLGVDDRSIERVEPMRRYAATVA